MTPTQDHHEDRPTGYYAHPRRFEGGRMVYPVLSRRSRGVSVGVNLFTCKLCNFNCLYCQVTTEGQAKAATGPIELAVLEQELRGVLGLAVSGELYEKEPFSRAAETLRRLNDIALSGDGEPTLVADFERVCELIVRVKRSLGLNGVKEVLITNASRLHIESVQRGLEILYGDEGEIWAKLDAGTEGYYQFLNQSAVSYSQILSNIEMASRVRPIVIQSLFLRIEGERVSRDEVRAYAQRLNTILERGGQIREVQIYTVARPCRDGRVSRLSREELQAVTEDISEVVSAPLMTYFD